MAEWFHTSVQIICDDGIAVSVVVESFPSWEVEVLGIVGEVHAALQDVFSSHRGEGVEIQADDEISVVGKEGSQLVVEVFLIELNLIELYKLEDEVLVHIIIYSSGVGGVIDGAVGLYKCLAGKEILALVILAHRQIEVAVDALILLKLQMRPLSLVDESLQRLLQVVENSVVRARNLSMVDGNLRLQFLRMNIGCTTNKQGASYIQYLKAEAFHIRRA